MKQFKVQVIGVDGHEVPPYDMAVPENSLFVSTTELGANAIVTVSSLLSTQKFYVNETVDQLIDNTNGVKPITIKSYYALLSQSGSDNPNANILNAYEPDFLDAIIWTRTGAGVYVGTLTGQLTVDLTFIAPIYKNDGTLAIVDTTDLPNSFLINTGTDGKLTNAPIEVKVFETTMAL